MKTYIDHEIAVVFENNWIPKNISNRHYLEFLLEVKNGEAELIKHSPSLSWEDIKAKRNILLKESDWTDLPNAPVKNRLGWIDYRQSLRDITEKFNSPAEVVWPKKP